MQNMENVLFIFAASAKKVKKKKKNTPEKENK